MQVGASCLTTFCTYSRQVAAQCGWRSRAHAGLAEAGGGPGPRAPGSSGQRLSSALLLCSVGAPVSSIFDSITKRFSLDPRFAENSGVIKFSSESICSAPSKESACVMCNPAAAKLRTDRPVIPMVRAKRKNHCRKQHHTINIHRQPRVSEL